MIAYAILTTPRTGSTLLCDYLSNTKQLGIRSIETANLFIGTGPEMAKRYPKSWWDYVEMNKTRNGVFGTKFMFEYFDNQIRQHLTAKQANDIMSLFDHYIWLRRADVVRQAVSWHIALKTGRWHSSNKDKPERPVTYDYDEIAWKVAFIDGMNRRYEQWFEMNGIEPLEIWYKDVVLMPDQVLLWVYRHLEMDDKNVPELKTTLEPKKDPRKDEYVKRFNDETRRNMEFSSPDRRRVAAVQPTGEGGGAV